MSTTISEFQSGTADVKAKRWSLGTGNGCAVTIIIGSGEEITMNESTFRRIVYDAQAFYLADGKPISDEDRNDLR